MSEGASASGDSGAGAAAPDSGTPTQTPPAAKPSPEVKPDLGADDDSDLGPVERPKGKVSLPGVVTVDEADEAMAETLFGKKGSEPGDRKTRAPERDPNTGRFVKAGEGEAEAAPAPDKPGLPEGTPDPTQEPEAEGQFKFADKVYKDQAEAEQSFKSLQGMHKSFEARVRTAEGERDYGYTAANAWKAEAERLQAENAALKEGKATPASNSESAGSGAPESVEDVMKSIDMDAFEYLATRGGLAQAGEYLIGEVMRAVTEKILPSRLAEIENKVNQRFQPIDAQTQHAEAVNRVTSAATQLQSLQTLDGKAAFPELHDHDTMTKVAEIWGEEGGEIEALQSPQGLMRAIALYRLAEGFASVQEKPSTTSNPDLPATPVAPGASASLGESGRSRVNPTGPRSNLPPGLAALVTEFSKPDMVDKSLGFARIRER